MPVSDILANEFYENNNIREIIKNMAEEGGLRVSGTRQSLHLVADGEGSIFATTYTQMKGKYNILERRKRMPKLSKIRLTGCKYDGLKKEHEHDNNGYYTIENLPLYDENTKEVTDINVLDGFLTDNRRDFIKYSQSSVRRKDSDYFRYLESRGIYIYRRINSSYDVQSYVS